MALILSIDTATKVCSVVLARNGELVDIQESHEEKSHASKLAVFIEKILKDNFIKAEQLDAIAISKGPGSYTGLRIGVSTAKGLCFGTGIPLIAINTLRVMANGFIQKCDKLSGKEFFEEALFCPLLDARRMEVYGAVYNRRGETVEETKAVIINDQSYSGMLQNNQVVFFGDGAKKCKEIIKHTNAIFYESFHLSASYMISIAEEAYEKKQFEDIAYFEPFYLKDFIATTPKNKILG